MLKESSIVKQACQQILLGLVLQMVFSITILPLSASLPAGKTIYFQIKLLAGIYTFLKHQKWR